MGEYYPLGALRNYAIENSNGDLFCQWDDDDWYNAFRLQYQYESMSKNFYPASVLDRWLLFDSLNEKAYISGRRLWEGSLLCWKDMFSSQKYKHISRGEDTPFVEYLYDNQQLYLIENKPNLYIYNYHGHN